MTGQAPGPSAGPAPQPASAGAPSASGPGRAPAWRRWLRAGLLVAGFASLFLVRSIVDTRASRVRASRAELGSIELQYGQGPTGVKGWVATFNIDRPPAVIWAVLSDCRNFPRVLKGVASCTLLRQEGNAKHHRMVLTHPEKAYMVTRTEYDLVARRTSWRMTEGSFKAAEGGIRLDAHPRHRGWTRVTYAYHLNISSVVPESFEVPRVRRSVRRMAQEIQAYFTSPSTSASRRVPAPRRGREARRIPRP